VAALLRNGADPNAADKSGMKPWNLVSGMGIATGDWGLPEGQKYEEMPEEAMLPPAEKMPSATSVGEVKEMLRADRELAIEMVRSVGEMDLAGKLVGVPWSPESRRPIGHHFLHMIDHLASHKSQLFYYLKLMGRPLHTGNLWGG